jgi:Glycosyltransferase Family 4
MSGVIRAEVCEPLTVGSIGGSELGVTHHWLDFHTIDRFPRMLTNTTDAARAYDRVQPDLIIFSDNCPPSNLAAIREAVRRNIPFVIVEGFVAPYLADLFRNYSGEFATNYERAREVIAASEENLRLLRSHFGLPPHNGRLIRHGRSDTFFHAPDLRVRQRLRRSTAFPRTEKEPAKLEVQANDKTVILKDFMKMSGYLKRLRIWESHYGKDPGWIIERQGEPIAVLSNPRTEEMFWCSFDLEIVTADSELQRRLTTVEFWSQSEAEGLVYRSKAFGDVAKYAFPALSPFIEPGRLVMRGLYLQIGEPLPWDCVVLWFRRSVRRTMMKR